ncbi:extracellular solute-binding protein [Myxococcota bacterium]|nr:extracellular solute-binding protein [Myxococcota bacterium]MBU1380761.1 extracellular solute-binding protein [Myxococcota bacterium]MBU1497098.1 extracellular solute-binding protein [Myxococcota bacterium]
MTPSRILLLILFFITLALPYIFRPAKATPDWDEKIVVISVHPEDIKYEFTEGFARYMKKCCNRKVGIEWVDLGGTSSSLRFIRSEFTNLLKDGRKNSSYDIFFGGGDQAHEILADSNCVKSGSKSASCLASYIPPEHILNQIPESLNGIKLRRDGYWYGSALSGFGIICNRKVLDFNKIPEPRSWQDLGRREFLSWVGSGDPRQSGSTHMLFEIILQSLGWEKGWQILMEMAGNTRYFSRHGSMVSADTALGEIACGITIDYYALSVIKTSPRHLAFILPEDATVINPDPISMLADAPHRELAEKFMEFVLGEGQYLRIRPKGHPQGPVKKETPVMPIAKKIYYEDGPRTIPANPYEYKSSFRYHSKLGSVRWNLLNDLLGSAFLDNHALVVKAWKRRLAGKISDADWKRVCTPPVTESELGELSKNLHRQSKSFRTDLRLKWFNYYYKLLKSVL